MLALALAAVVTLVHPRRSRPKAGFALQYSSRAHLATMVYDTKPTIDAMRTLDTLVSRGLDTLEDALLLARRVAADVVDPIDCLDTWTDSSDPRPRVLVIDPAEWWDGGGVLQSLSRIRMGQSRARQSGGCRLVPAVGGQPTELFHLHSDASSK